MQYIRIVTLCLLALHCYQTYADDIKTQQFQFVKSRYGIDGHSLDSYILSRNERFNKCKLENKDCYGDAFINWYINIEKKYDLFIFEKQLLFDLVENKSNSIKNDYFGTISIICENNDGIINKKVGFNLSSVILNFYIGNKLKVYFDKSNYYEFNKGKDLFQNINNDDFVNIVEKINNSKTFNILLSGNTMITSSFVKFEGNVPYDIVEKVCIGDR